MNNLSAPLMLYWDVAASDGASRPDLADKISRDIASSGIFILNLEDAGGRMSAATESILTQLKNSAVQIVLTVGGEKALDAPAMELLAASRLKRLLFRVGSLDELRSLSKSLPDYGRHAALGVSFALNGENLEEAPAVIEFCLANEHLKAGVHEIPIARANGDKKIFVPGPEVIKKLAGETSKIPLEKLNILVHDPFLWPVFARGKSPNAEGCHAAQTMLYIRPDFEVTPCPIMPWALGDLRRMGLREIFSSAKKRQVREMLDATPGACLGCREADTCQGGCRGRAFALSGSLDEKDPACPVKT
ncbi:MAG: SPASM domain-containing protein [Nitrospiraceae bacterium]|nr:SPASM domain-containing protein [Nitrospiraceae bacterium]